MHADQVRTRHCYKLVWDYNHQGEKICRSKLDQDTSSLRKKREERAGEQAEKRGVEREQILKSKERES